MKNCLLFLLFLLTKSASGQLNDNFSDGDFSTNPAWSGNGYQVNASQQVQSANSGGIAQTVNLITPNLRRLNALWEFYVQINLDPSTNNQVRIYLLSDNVDLSGNLNGYFLQIGESGSSDSYDLYRQDGLSVTKIIDGPPKTRVSASQLLARVRVSRTIDGIWEVLTDISGGNTFVLEGSGVDLKYVQGGWFGLQCKYSSTNSDKFIFDDFSISQLDADSEPPQIVSTEGLDPKKIKVVFNEPITPESATNPANYSLNNNYGQPVTVSTGNLPNEFILQFNTELISNLYTLTISNLADFNFNQQVLPSTLDFNYVKPYEAQAMDVVINEIFADPSPQIDLPGLEFIELWNTSNQLISLDKWTYSDASSTYTFGNESLQANERAILCALTEVANFNVYGKVIGISPWPSLNNSNDLLSLKNANGQIIHQVNYADTWYKDAVKKEGGWSLELINPKALCSGIQNWIASLHPAGGTPGQTNSVYSPNDPIEPLKINSAEMLDSVTLSVRFNRFVDSTSAATPAHYTLNNGVGQPATAIALSPYFEEVQLKFAIPPSLGKNYTLIAGPVSDCAGETLAAPNNHTSFYLSDKIQKGDLLISEILFNPRIDGVDFVEIYNHTEHALDLKDLRIASLSEQDSLISIKEISKVQTLLQAKEYLAISTNTGNILTEYPLSPPAKMLQVPSMPAFNDDAGSIVLVRADSLRIDQFNYNEKMHFPLIKDAEGVSLERSSFAVAANEPGNFRSAAASIGFATPGTQNSQFIPAHSLSEEISLESTTLSPDNDGFEDALTIHYQFAQAGMVANLNIFSDKGHLVRRLVKSTTLGTSGAFVWDGLSDQTERVPIGIYLIRLEVFDLSGKVKTFVKPCVVATHLN
ncbi:MAG: hypothetical protein RI924_99 [Bacteroidota bacterium]|jgi:hypothetical protein